jgi:hypothetical protein
MLQEPPSASHFPVRLGDVNVGHVALLSFSPTRGGPLNIIFYQCKDDFLTIDSGPAFPTVAFSPENVGRIDIVYGKLIVLLSLIIVKAVFLRGSAM